MDVKIFKNRQKRIRQALAQTEVNCLIVTKSANVTYVTGFSGEDSWVIILPEKVILITDSRYAEQARKECKLCRIIVREEGMFKAVAAYLRKHRGLKIAVEKSTSIAEFEQLKKQLKARLKTVANIVETARRTKDQTEIAAIKAAAKIAADAFKIIRMCIRPDMTENELAGLLDFEIRKLGAFNSFETIVAFGPNASRPHHRPTQKKLRKNDTILIDFGVRHNGYCCDITRCLTIGRVNSLYRKVYDTVRKAQLAAMNLVKAGVEIKKVDSAARAVIKKQRLPVFGHGTGHGLGLEIHELPSISPKSQGKLQPGDVVTIEPGIYMPGRLGVRIEDDVLITNEGYEFLTKQL
jgi:Xaa-Pro aminopeptidase